MADLSLKGKNLEQDLDISEPKRKPSPKILIPIGLLIVGIGGLIWYFRSPAPIKSLQLSGRIEGYETNIGAKFAGRVNFVAVREGDKVYKGEVIVRMDDQDLQAQIKGATARIKAAQQQEQQARLQIDVLKSQIAEQQLNLQQAKGDTQGRVFQAESFLASSLSQTKEAKANLRQALSALKLARNTRDRYGQLIEAGVIPQIQFDQTQTALETAQATVSARQSSLQTAIKQVQVAQGQLQQAKTTQFNPTIRQEQIQRLTTQLAQSRQQLAATQGDVENAQAVKQEIHSKITDLKVISPINGVVTTRSVEPGAVVTTGKTLLTVINPEFVYLRGFIPEDEIGKVRVGQSAKIFLDSAPKQPLKGRVSAIDTEASFTPENIYFKEDRVKQVFGVKISLDHPDGLAKPGMPADAEILTDTLEKPVNKEK